MRYDEYYQEELERYQKKMATLKKLPFIIIAGVILLAGFITLFLTSGTPMQTQIDGFSYGQEMTSAPKAFLATSFYQYKVENEFTSEVPTVPGEYTYRIKSVSLLGRVTYSEEFTFTISKRRCTVYCANTTVKYGEKPIAYGDLINGDTLASYEFVYENQHLARTSVHIDEETVKIVDVNGNDVTEYYDVRSRTSSIQFTEVPIVITVKDAEKPYDGTALTATDYEIELEDGSHELLYENEISFNMVGSQIYAGTSTATVDMDSVVIKTKDGQIVENYRYDVVPGTLTVTPIAVTIATTNETIPFDGQEHTLEDYMLSRTIPDEITVTPVKCTDVDVYSYDLKPTFATEEIANSYILTKSYGIIDVVPQTIHVTLVDMEKQYDKTDVVEEVEYTTSDDLFGATLVVEGKASRKEMGLGVVTATSYTITKDGKDQSKNYDIVFMNESIVNIKKRSITIKPTSASKEYTGDVIVVDGTDNTNTQLMGNDVISYTAYSSDSSIGTHDLTLSSYVIKDGDKVVTDSYQVIPEVGSITITKRKLTITIDNVDVTYGDTAVFQYYVSNQSLLTGHMETVVYKVDGTEYPAGKLKTTAAGEKDIDGVLTLKDLYENDVSEYYETKIVQGKLSIARKNLTIGIKNITKEYDGDDLVYVDSDLFIADGELIETDEIMFTAPNIKQNDVGTQKTNLSIEANVVIEDKASVRTNVANNYNITFVNGTLTVTKRKLIVIAGSAIKEYDFSTLTCSTYTSKGLLAEHTLQVNISSEIKSVGTTSNRISSVTVFDKDDKDITAYYTIVTYDGILTYTERSA